MSDTANVSAEKAERRRKGFLLFAVAVVIAAIAYGAWWLREKVVPFLVRHRSHLRESVCVHD